ncbi:hypothetical protein ACWEQN_41325 [Streptomyces sp. NPDC004129]|uniref:hypothetical protein n=1 Tax=Streptomyces sp. NPDC002573 TaxID=3364651 RepID=UPI0036C17BA2
METQVWTSLLGVALGGGLSYLAQITAGRQASRSEDKRQATEVAEARRAERLELLREFISLTQQGIRLAEEREDAPDWDAAATPEWLAAARGLIDQLWTCERMIQVLFPPDAYQRAQDYASAVDQVLWREYEHNDASLWDVLQGPQTAFLQAAHGKFG